MNVDQREWTLVGQFRVGSLDEDIIYSFAMITALLAFIGLKSFINIEGDENFKGSSSVTNC